MKRPLSEGVSPQSDQAQPDGAPSAAADRGISPIAGPMGGRRGRMIILASVIAGGGVFLAATWDRGPDAERGGAGAETPPRQMTPFEPARRGAPQLSDAAIDPDAPALSAGEEIPPIEPAAHTAANDSAPSAAETRRALAESAQRAPVLAYSRSRSDASPPTAAPFADQPQRSQNPTALDTLRQVSPIGGSLAGALPDRNLLVTAGAVLPCVLQTAMDSTAPGYVSCVLPRDVYSESGTVVLLERGTRVLGEYRSGLQQGRRRLFVLWTRAVTPTGVTMTLASPASDALGRAGFDGQIDTHFWDRFGGALLLSLVDDAAYTALGDGDDLRSTARVPSDAAASALQGSLDIPATLRKAQGAEVSIFVAQDLDFRSVYRLSARP